MKRIAKPVDERYLNCPIRNVLDKFGDKWSLLVLYYLHIEGTMRFSELNRNMADCSQKMLSQTLRRLEQIGLLVRKVYPEVPPRTEYTLTATGNSLMPHVEGLIGWSEQHFGEIAGK
ncbi:MAG: helix-turn-helix transcriptional regulator [Bacteroidales bacterium]|nr:helix-turn-helix transcriptional regulator [Bacteroidales bacterium]